MRPHRRIHEGYKAERIWIVCRVLKTSYGKPVRSVDEVVEILVDLSLKSKFKGILALEDDEEETTNFFFYPCAANVKERTAQELLLQKIIAEGVIAIENELHPRMLEMKLKSFLTPSSRSGQLVSLERIQKRSLEKGVEGRQDELEFDETEVDDVAN